MPSLDDVAVVVIGRNEGERLRRCLLSLQGVPHQVYVDSGSTDGSQELARSMGVEVIHLQTPPGYTAARARNAGLEHLLRQHPSIRLVQMVDGDCEIISGWLSSAVGTLEEDQSLAAVFGRLRERYPERSVYNRLCDIEWNVPVGEARSCGGIAMFRIEAIGSAGGYSETLIAGEEPDLCLRMRRNGWRIFRIGEEMALHDAAMTKLSQWWRRTRRTGHAFAELSYIHGANGDPNWKRQVRSILAWGFLTIGGMASGLAALGTGKTALLLPLLAATLLHFVQVSRLAAKRKRLGEAGRASVAWALATLYGKLPQLQGMMGFHLRRMLGRKSRIIEYKT